MATLIYTCVNGDRIEYIINGSNCCVLNSFLTTNKESKLDFIRFLRKHFPQFSKRSERSYFREWKVHNLCYKLNFEINRTRDTDLDYTESRIRKIGYFIVALFTSNKI